VLSAAPWYTSGTVWGAAGFVAVVLFGALTTLVTFIVGTPRRQLTYSLLTDVPLLGWAPQQTRQDVQVLFRDKPLHNPRVLSVRLTARGRRDIRSSDFDQSKPLALDVGVRIVGVLGSKNMPAPCEGTRFLVGPALIRKRQSMTYTVLADGPGAHLTCDSPLIDVVVREQVKNDRQRASKLNKVSIYSAWIGGGLATALSAGISGVLRTPIPIAGMVVLGILAAVTIGVSAIASSEAVSPTRGWRRPRR
jgi:hypothetical protein